MRRQLRVERAEGALRATGRAIVMIGLAALYGSFTFVFLAGGGPPIALWKAAFVLTTIGCFGLIGLLNWRRPNERNVAVEATSGFLCLPPVLLGGFFALGDELRQIRTFWLVITIFPDLGAIALIV